MPPLQDRVIFVGVVAHIHDISPVDDVGVGCNGVEETPLVLPIAVFHGAII